MVTFFLYGRPFLYKLLQRTEPPYGRLGPGPSPPSRGQGEEGLPPGVLSVAEKTVRSTGNQSSGVLRSMAFGNALVVLPPDRDAREGEEVEVIPLTFVP